MWRLAINLKCKIFISQHNKDELQLEINEWLDYNKGIKVSRILQSSDHYYINITIWYYDVEPVEEVKLPKFVGTIEL